MPSDGFDLEVADHHGDLTDEVAASRAAALPVAVTAYGAAKLGEHGAGPSRL